MVNSTLSLWEVSDENSQVRAWIRDVLAQQAITLTAPIEQIHQRPWSTVLRVPTDQGNLFFKAAALVARHETAVTQTIYQQRPDTLPPVLASHAERGWLLLADGGQHLREAFKAGKPLSDWSQILADYAELQIALAGQVNELLAAGTPDQRLAQLPGLYEEILADTDWLLIDQPDGLTGAEFQYLTDAVPQVATMCRQLAAHAIPESLHHNDLHDGNIFVGDGRYLFYDWGDCCIAHPFFSLRTAFVSMENTFGLEENDPVFDTIGEAYLARWANFAIEEDLKTAFGLARRLWALSTAVKYRTFLLGIEDETFRTDYATAVPSLLQEFLAANPELRRVA